MKRFLLTAFLFICMVSAWSQAVAEVFTENDFQGKWKLVAYTTKDGTIDLSTGVATVDIAIQKKFGAEYAKNLKKEMEARKDELSDDYLEVTGNKFSLYIDNEVRTGSYKISRDKKNNQVTTATFKDKSKSTVPIIMKDGKIVLNQKYTGKIFTFAKWE